MPGTPHPQAADHALRVLRPVLDSAQKLALEVRTLEDAEALDVKLRELWPLSVLRGMFLPIADEIQAHVRSEWAGPRSAFDAEDAQGWTSRAAQKVHDLFGSLRRGASAALLAAKLAGAPLRTEVKSWAKTGAPTRHGSLASRLEIELGDMTHQGAMRWHREQAALNGALFAPWVWRSQGDRFVRKTHRTLNGQRFAANEKPSEGYPGEPHGCRCWRDYVPAGRDSVTIGAMPVRQPRDDRGLAVLDFAPGASLAPGVAPAVTDATTGFVRATAFLARDGLLVYGDGKETWKELRSREDLVEAAATFADVPLTDLHPADMVTTENADAVARGHVVGTPTVTEPDAAGISYLQADLLITSKDLLAKIKDGMHELSIGFWAHIVDAPEGTGARFAQVSLIGNHVSGVPKGRAGPNCRVFLDAHRVDMEPTDTTDYPLPDGSIVQIPTPVAALISQLQGVVAELQAAAKEPEDEDNDEQKAMSKPADKPKEDPKAKKPEDKDKPKGTTDGVQVPRAIAVKLVTDAMPWLVDKIDDDTDLQPLLAVALLKPEPKPEDKKTDGKPKGQTQTPEPFPANTPEAKTDDASNAIIDGLARVGFFGAKG